MRILGVAILSVLLFAEGALAQGPGAPGAKLTGNNAKILQDFKNTLSPEQRNAITELGKFKPTQSKVCPSCSNVEDSQLVAHVVESTEQGSEQQHIMVPRYEESRLDAINSTLWKTLTLLKGADEEYMGKYVANEKANAPTTLEQIEMRTDHINSLIDELSKRTKTH